MLALPLPGRKLGSAHSRKIIASPARLFTEMKMKQQLSCGGLLRWTLQLLRNLLLRIVSHFRAELQVGQPCLHSLQIVPKYVPIPRVKGLPLVGTLFDLINAGGAPQ